jgi:hypothetical protein
MVAKVGSENKLASVFAETDKDLNTLNDIGLFFDKFWSSLDKAKYKDYNKDNTMITSMQKV